MVYDTGAITLYINLDNIIIPFIPALEVKNYNDAQTFEWFADKAGMLKELRKVRKKYMENLQNINKEEKNEIETEKIEITLPVHNKLISTFANQIGRILKDKNALFFNSNTRDTIEILKLFWEGLTQ